MSRPIYESALDSTKERMVAISISKTSGCRFLQMPRLSAFDYAYHNGQVVKFFAEIKCRNNPMSAYPTYMISYTKRDAAMTIKKLLNVSTWLVVVWGCGNLGTLDLSEINPSHIKLGGRTDRGDLQDQELCAYYPIELFKVRTDVS
jgi:hypothetical protein